MAKKVKKKAAKNSPAENLERIKPSLDPSAVNPASYGKRVYHTRGVKGRDGSGPVTVVNGSLILPNGDLAKKGDTFDPIEEGMSVNRLEHLMVRKIVKAEKGTEDRLADAWINGTKPEVASEDPDSE